MDTKAVYSERRTDGRQRVLKSAKVDLHRGIVTVDGQIRDLSIGGARLRLRQADSLPQRFTLVLTANNDVYPSQVIWRRDDEVGISFSDNAA